MLYRTKPRSSTGRMLRLPVIFAFSALTLFGCGNDEPQTEAMAQSEGTQHQSASPGNSSESADRQSTAAASSVSDETQPGAEASAENSSTTTVQKDEAATEGAVEVVQVANKETVSEPATAEEPAGTGDSKTPTADPAVFDALLKANVSNGKVNYNGFKNSSAFAGYLQSIASTSLEGMSTNEKLAFWVNAYNALVIKNVLDNPGIKQPLDVPGFFDKKKFSAAGKSVTLNQIENDIIRPTFREPLIHFGLVCAARSCPPLINKAYTAANVRSLLAANARSYLADTRQNRFADGTLYLSKIFEWYKADFGGDDAGLRAFAQKYGPASMKDGIGDATPVSFNEYDWTLNSK